MEATSAPVVRLKTVVRLAARDEPRCGIDRVLIAAQVAEADHAAEQRRIVIGAEVERSLVERERCGVGSNEVLIRGGQVGDSGRRREPRKQLVEATPRLRSRAFDGQAGDLGASKEQRSLDEPRLAVAYGFELRYRVELADRCAIAKQQRGCRLRRGGRRRGFRGAYG